MSAMKMIAAIYRNNNKILRRYRYVDQQCGHFDESRVKKAVLT
jgi:hypothetical protein